MLSLSLSLLLLIPTTQTTAFFLSFLLFIPTPITQCLSQPYNSRLLTFFSQRAEHVAPTVVFLLSPIFFFWCVHSLHHYICIHSTSRQGKGKLCFSAFQLGNALYVKCSLFSIVPCEYKQLAGASSRGLDILYSRRSFWMYVWLCYGMAWYGTACLLACYPSHYREKSPSDTRSRIELNYIYKVKHLLLTAESSSRPVFPQLPAQIPLSSPLLSAPCLPSTRPETRRNACRYLSI